MKKTSLVGISQRGVYTAFVSIGVHDLPCSLEETKVVTHPLIQKSWERDTRAGMRESLASLVGQKKAMDKDNDLSSFVTLPPSKIRTSANSIWPVEITLLFTPANDDQPCGWRHEEQCESFEKVQACLSTALNQLK